MRCLTILFLLLWMSEAAAQTVKGTATLPLDQLRKLNEAAAKGQVKPVVKPIIFERFAMTGSISGDNIEATAHVKVSVHDTNWQSRALMSLGEDLAISQLPELKQAALHIEGGKLWFSSQTPGDYSFDIQLVLLGNAAKKNKVTLQLDQPTLAKLNLKFSNSYFKVKAEKFQDWAEGIVILGSRQGLSFEWETLHKTRVPRQTTVVEQRRINPHIDQMRASFIATQNGRKILQVQHHVVLSESEELTISLPDGFHMDALYVDGQDTPFKQENDTVALVIKPQKIGGFETVVEITARSSGSAYLLSGDFAIELPQLNLPVKNLELQAFLPEVFEYQVKGGSMRACEDCQEQVTYVDSLPTPGLSFRFQEQLVTDSIPRVEMSYAVELKDQYYKG